MIKTGVTKRLSFYILFNFNYFKCKELHMASGYCLESTVLEISCANRNIEYRHFIQLGYYMYYSILFFPLNNAIYAII